LVTLGSQRRLYFCYIIIHVISIGNALLVTTVLCDF